MSHLTCNQFILLCAVYRGTEHTDSSIGTREHDLKHLRAQGLVQKRVVDGRLELTTAGHDRVQRALNDECRVPTNLPIPASIRPKLKELAKDIQRAYREGRMSDVTRLTIEALKGPDGAMIEYVTVTTALFNEDMKALMDEVNVEFNQEKP